jgi:hypothetical protein
MGVLVGVAVGVVFVGAAVGGAAAVAGAASVVGLAAAVGAAGDGLGWEQAPNAISALTPRASRSFVCSGFMSQFRRCCESARRQLAGQCR